MVRSMASSHAGCAAPLLVTKTKQPRASIGARHVTQNGSREERPRRSSKVPAKSRDPWLQCTPDFRRGAARSASADLASVDQPVELARVLAGHLVGDVGRQMAELLVDVLLRLRPDTVGTREVGAPHQGLDPHTLDQLGADPVVLEGRAALFA